MNQTDFLSAYHHKFRFLLEELSYESEDILKKNRLVEEFKNEIDVYCYASASILMNVSKRELSPQRFTENSDREYIKNLVDQLKTSAKNNTDWEMQIARLKEEVEKLLIQHEKTINIKIRETQNLEH